jgi:hypothetical protein
MRIHKGDAMNDIEETLLSERAGAAGKLAEALAKAQGEIRNPARGSENPHFKSKYTNLADGIAAIRGPLSKHGVAWVQITHIDGDILMLTTSLIHAVSGQTLDATWPVGAYAKLTPQQMGSALTYAKRYTLFSLVGIAGADEDDDGNAASTASPLIDVDQIAFVEQLVRDTDSNLTAFLAVVGAPSVAEMTVEQFKRAISMLEQKKRRMS